MDEKSDREIDTNSEKTKINSDFCKCPFCQCCFFSTRDLETHIATFGSSREQHFENHRVTHARIEHGSANGPE